MLLLLAVLDSPELGDRRIKQTIAINQVQTA